MRKLPFEQQIPPPVATKVTEGRQTTRESELKSGYHRVLSLRSRNSFYRFSEPMKHICADGNGDCNSAFNWGNPAFCTQGHDAHQE